MKSDPVGDVMNGLVDETKESVARALSPLAQWHDDGSKAADELENMLLWRSVEKTDPRYVSPIAGTNLSNVDATYQKGRATEMWGPYGKHWGLRDIVLGQTPETGLPVEIWAKAKFFSPESEFEIIDDIAWRRGDDCRKKLMTRLLKKALSYYGFSALIYMGKSDDDGASHEATDDHEKIFASLKQAALQANNEPALKYVQEKATETRLSRFHLSSLAAICAERAEFLGIEMPGM